MKNATLNDFRNLMLQAMEMLIDPAEDQKFGVEEAKAVAQLGKMAVESAKAETQHLKVLEEMGISSPGTGFINTTSPKQLN